MNVTKKDQIWLGNNFFPDEFNFKEDTNGYNVEGIFMFSVFFSKEKQGYILNPKDEYRKEKNYIRDRYEIAFFVPRKNDLNDNFYRNIKETGGRLERTAKKFKLKIEDLHMNSRGKTLCIAGLFQENYELSFQEFIKGPFLQFFYDQSYCERSLCETGRINWPRGEYSHGLKGILESYLDACQDIDEINKFKITKVLLEKIVISNEHDVKNDIRRILDHQTLSKITIYSKYMHGIFNLREAMNIFGLKLIDYNL